MMLKKILQDTIPNPNLVLPPQIQSGTRREPTIEELKAKAAAMPKKNKAR
jgi:hypothetical protein